MIAALFGWVDFRLIKSRILGNASSGGHNAFLVISNGGWILLREFGHD
jgi:hypothetical protein